MKHQKTARRAKPVTRKGNPKTQVPAAFRSLLPVYSGPKSDEFWARVNALSGRENHTMYSVGILLQELEARVLGWLQQAEQEAWGRSLRVRRKDQRP